MKRYATMKDHVGLKVTCSVSVSDRVRADWTSTLMRTWIGLLHPHLSPRGAGRDVSVAPRGRFLFVYNKSSFYDRFYKRGTSRQRHRGRLWFLIPSSPALTTLTDPAPLLPVT